MAPWLVVLAAPLHWARIQRSAVLLAWCLCRVLLVHHTVVCESECAIQTWMDWVLVREDVGRPRCGWHPGFARAVGAPCCNTWSGGSAFSQDTTAGCCCSDCCSAVRPFSFVCCCAVASGGAQRCTLHALGRTICFSVQPHQCAPLRRVLRGQQP